jgi:hypothetical protein
VDIHGHSRSLDAFFYCCALPASQQPPVLPLGQLGTGQQVPGLVEAQAAQAPCRSKQDLQLGGRKGAAGEGVGGAPPRSGWSIGVAVGPWMQEKAGPGWQPAAGSREQQRDEDGGLQVAGSSDGSGDEGAAAEQQLGNQDTAATAAATLIMLAWVRAGN